VQGTKPIAQFRSFIKGVFVLKFDVIRMSAGRSFDSNKQQIVRTYIGSHLHRFTPMMIRNRNSVRFTSGRGTEKPATLGLLRFMARCLLLSSLCFVSAKAQAPNRPSMSDQAREIERVEMNQQLLLKRLPAINDDSARKALLKQISEDFRDIQGLNNKMMADTWSREEPNYNFISDTISQIRGKANRLKLNLSLPESHNSDRKEFQLGDVDVKQFRAALLVLDKSIMSFVTNPIFRETKIVEMKMATQASRDLETVLQLSGNIKKAASRLNKKSKNEH